jgi:serine/threonine protein kinase
MTVNLEKDAILDGRYLLKERIGRGGFSEVWLVEDIKTNLGMAMKIYAPGMGLDAENIAVFNREFALVFELNHPNLLRPNYYGEIDGMPFLILPYCKNGSAVSLVGEMDENTAWRFLHDVASGLAYLHSQEPPVIHQDIKPDNIMIGNNRQFLITDFGISVKVRYTQQRNVSSGDITGTLAFSGPERFGRNPAPVKASDIWALGATLYEIITGDLPFGPNGGVIQRSGAEIPEIQGNYSDELKMTIEKCLSLNPWDRPTADRIEALTADIGSITMDKVMALTPNINNVTVDNTADDTQDKPADDKTVILEENVPLPSNGAVSGHTVLMENNNSHESGTQMAPSEPIGNGGKKRRKKRWIVIAAPVAVAVAAVLLFRYYSAPKPTSDNKDFTEITEIIPAIAADTVIADAVTVDTFGTDSLQDKEDERQDADFVPSPKDDNTATDNTPKPKPQPQPVTDYMQEGNKCYGSGNYSLAIENYRKADNQDAVKARIKSSEKCLEILKEADKYFKNNEFEKAKDEYNKILQENQSDRNAKEKISICEKQLNTKN